MATHGRQLLRTLDRVGTAFRALCRLASGLSSGRFYDNADAVHDELIRFHWRDPIDVIIHGGTGVTHRCGRMGVRQSCGRRALWQSFGKRAESRRNDFMIADSRPDFLIVFPGERATADLVAKAIAAGINVVHARPSRRGGGMTDMNLTDESRSPKEIG
jgi:hypothetical protein